jgi:hypothetical protein
MARRAARQLRSQLAGPGRQEYLALSPLSAGHGTINSSFRGSDPQNSMVAPFQAKRQSRNGT